MITNYTFLLVCLIIIYIINYSKLFRRNYQKWRRRIGKSNDYSRWAFCPISVNRCPAAYGPSSFGVPYGIDANVVRVHQLPSGALIGADFSNEGVGSLKATELVKESDNIIMLTPVYETVFFRYFKNFFKFYTCRKRYKMNPSFLLL